MRVCVCICVLCVFTCDLVCALMCKCVRICDVLCLCTYQPSPLHITVNTDKLPRLGQVDVVHATHVVADQ